MIVIGLNDTRGSRNGVVVDMWNLPVLKLIVHQLCKWRETEKHWINQIKRKGNHDNHVKHIQLDDPLPFKIILRKQINPASICCFFATSVYYSSAVEGYTKHELSVEDLLVGF